MCVSRFDAPIDFRTDGTLSVRLVVDDEFVLVGKGARFIVAAVKLSRALETEACANGGVNVLVCLAQGAVCCPTCKGIYGVVLARLADLDVVNILLHDECTGQRTVLPPTAITPFSSL